MEPWATDLSGALSIPSLVPFTPESLPCPSPPSPRRPPSSFGVTLARGLRSAQRGRPFPSASPHGRPRLCRQGGRPASRAAAAQPISARHAGGRAGSHQPDSGFLRRPRSAPAGPRSRAVPAASDRHGGPGGAAGERPRRQRPERRVSTGLAAGQGRAGARRGTWPRVLTSAGGLLATTGEARGRARGGPAAPRPHCLQLAGALPSASGGRGDYQRTHKR